MNSQILEDARNHERRVSESIPERKRPAFHLSSMAGWMNDPNGFSYYNGKYHMFYQYYPYASVWGLMHWGHAVSDDLLHWEFLPCALAPDRYYDQDGCYSGSAIDLPDGRQLLMYTAVRREEQPDHSIQGVQTQCLAIGNGLDYEKYPGNPVLTENHLPAGASRYDFRDPKIVRLADGSYRAYLGSRDAKGDGQILLYSSLDAFHWNFERVMIKNHERFGKMWECPDFFELDGYHVLLTSPQDMLPEGFEYHSGNGTLCLIGDYDEKTADFREKWAQSVDYGIDFYAPQTVVTPDGRRVMIGWMQNWDACAIREPESPWAGQMSLPRELTIRDGRLYQQPLSELNALHRNRVEYKNILISGDMTLPGIKGRKLDLTITIRPEDPEKSYNRFGIYFARNEKYYTLLRYRPRESTLKIDRKFSGSRRAIVHQRRCYVENAQKELTFRMILDRYSVEVFIQDGRQVMTATIYTEQSAEGVTFFSDGDVRMDIVKYDIDV